MGLSGLAQINIETTSHCDKFTLCGFCFHQSSEKLRLGEMDFALLEKIRAQLEPGTLTVQFHRDGDPLCYSRLRDSLDLFDGFIRSVVTHGEALARKADDLIERCEAITVSVFRADPDRAMQMIAIREFLEQKGDRLPRLLIKIVGDMDASEYDALGVPIMRRRLHDDLNSRYVKQPPLLPEQGVCLDFLSKPAIAWDGKMYQCVRFDETDAGFIGDTNTQTLEEIWHGEPRMTWLDAHLMGRRGLASSRCQTCTYFGIPATWTPSKELPMLATYGNAL